MGITQRFAQLWKLRGGRLIQWGGIHGLKSSLTSLDSGREQEQIPKTRISCQRVYKRKVGNGALCNGMPIFRTINMMTYNTHKAIRGIGKTNAIRYDRWFKMLSNISWQLTVAKNTSLKQNFFYMDLKRKRIPPVDLQLVFQ